MYSLHSPQSFEIINGFLRARYPWKERAVLMPVSKPAASRIMPRVMIGHLVQWFKQANVGLHVQKRQNKWQPWNLNIGNRRHSTSTSNIFGLNTHRMGVSRNFSRGNVNILLIPFKLLTMQCKRTFTKRPTFSTAQAKSHIMAAVTKMRFVCSNTKVYYDDLHNRLSADFPKKVLFKEALPWSLS